MRSVPMFPELVPYLEALAESVGVGLDVPMSAPVFPLGIDPRVNRRTQFSRMIVKAGLKPWDKLFVNLRSSRETELLGIYPATHVCRCMGHSPPIKKKFLRSAHGRNCGSGSPRKTVQSVDLPVGEMGVADSEKVVEMDSIGIPHQTAPKPQNADIPWEIGQVCDPVRGDAPKMTKQPVGGIGLEPTTSTMSSDFETLGFFSNSLEKCHFNPYFYRVYSFLFFPSVFDYFGVTFFCKGLQIRKRVTARTLSKTLKKTRFTICKIVYLTNCDLPNLLNSLAFSLT
jgi:hypothetical protein